MTERTEEEHRLTFDYELDAPPEKVWRALTIPALIDRWLLPLDLVEGGGFSGRSEALSTTVAAEVVEAERPNRLRWRWCEAGEPAGTVSFTLTPSPGGGTLLRLEHVRQARVLAAAANSNAPTMLLAA